MWVMVDEGILDSFHSENLGDWAVVNDGLYFINPEAKDGNFGRITATRGPREILFGLKFSF